jgi:hypothetical protein
MSAEANRLSWPTQLDLSGRYDQDPGNGRGRPVRVLFIDDDVSMQHTLADYLVERNMRVASASKRQAVIRHFPIDESDIVLLDIRLGQEDGFDLLREINMVPTKRGQVGRELIRYLLDLAQGRYGTFADFTDKHKKAPPGGREERFRAATRTNPTFGHRNGSSILGQDQKPRA